MRYGSREPDCSRSLKHVMHTQRGASGGSINDAVEWAGTGGAVLLAVPGSALASDAACSSLARLLGPFAAGKIVLDATNPLDRELNGLVWERGRSGAEVLAEVLPGGRPVQAGGRTATLGAKRWYSWRRPGCACPATGSGVVVG